jgi:hypothetical protein
MSRKLKLKHFRSDQSARGPPFGRLVANSPPICRRFPRPFFCRLFAALLPVSDSAAKQLLPARNKQILPGLPLIRLHQE